MEQLGIDADKKDIRFIGSYARINDFVEVYLLKSNVDIKDLKLQENEVQAAKWVSIDDFEQLVKDEKASGTGFNVFKDYYNNFYNRYLVFENGKPVFKN
ncbi:MAG: hypothetical protein IJO32_01780 [Bacilli bacterium]|nr:hypothetical protein [Bacilli bacterium]